MPSEHRGVQRWAAGSHLRGQCSTACAGTHRGAHGCAWVRLGERGSRAAVAQPPGHRQSHPAMRHGAVLRPDWRPAPARQRAARGAGASHGPVTQLIPAWKSPRQPRPRRVQLGLASVPHALHPLRQVSAPWHEGRGGTVQPGSALSPNHTHRASLCNPTPKQGSPSEPRTSLSVGSCINPPWPPPALALPVHATASTTPQ